jgi:hypothetical protein
MYSTALALAKESVAPEVRELLPQFKEAIQNAYDSWKWDEDISPEDIGGESSSIYGAIENCVIEIAKEKGFQAESGDVDCPCSVMMGRFGEAMLLCFSSEEHLKSVGTDEDDLIDVVPGVKFKDEDFELTQETEMYEAYFGEVPQTLPDGKTLQSFFNPENPDYTLDVDSVPEMEM